MSTSYVEQEHPENLPQHGSDTATHDVDELVRQVERTYSISSYWWMGRYVVEVVMTYLFINILRSVYQHSAGWELLLDSFGLFCLAAIGCYGSYYCRWKSSAYMRTHKNHLTLLRETGAVFAADGRISPLRWATIKNQLAQYGI